MLVLYDEESVEGGESGVLRRAETGGESEPTEGGFRTDSRSVEGVGKADSSRGPSQFSNIDARWSKSERDGSSATGPAEASRRLDDLDGETAMGSGNESTGGSGSGSGVGVGGGEGGPTMTSSKDWSSIKSATNSNSGSASGSGGRVLVEENILALEEAVPGRSTGESTEANRAGGSDPNPVEVLRKEVVDCFRTEGFGRVKVVGAGSLNTGFASGCELRLMEVGEMERGGR